MYYIHINLFLLMCTNVYATSSRLIHPKNPSDLTFGGEMVQMVAHPYTYVDGLYWCEKGSKLYFVDRFGSTLNVYDPKTGELQGYFFQDLVGIEVSAIFPVKGRVDKFVIAAGQSIYLVTKEVKNNTDIFGIKPVFNITDNSRIIAKACTTRNSQIYLGLKPSNYAEQFPNITKGKAQFMIVDLEHKNITILEDNYTKASGVAIDYNGDYRYHTDEIENKIWRRKLATGSELELIFDMNDYKDILTGLMTTITLDIEGNLWIAFYNTFQIIQFDVEKKSILRHIPIPVHMIVSLAWGGPNYEILYAGTTSKYIDDLRRVPAAGSVIAISGTGSRGYKQNELIVAKDWLD